jgi:phage N-6-adenine-methyltransferase
MDTVPHFSSHTVEWPTPQYLFDFLNRTFGFEIDVCATIENAKCPRFFTKEEDGLKQDWDGRCWMNPPYGREIGKWVEKAARCASVGTLVVALLPARTDTTWWHNYVLKYGDVHFMRGRVKFGKSKNSAPFPSAIVIFWAKP